MYVIKLIGMNDKLENSGYYKSVEDDCFKFVRSQRNATRFNTLQDCRPILDFSEWYVALYGARAMKAVEVEE